MQENNLNLRTVRLPTPEYAKRLRAINGINHQTRLKQCPWRNPAFYYRPQRSCGQGYVFTRVCDSVHGGGLRRTPPGPGRHQPPLDQGEPPPGPGRHPPGPGRTPPQTRQTPLREEDCSIRSMSGRYASYWNAFLFNIKNKR